MNEKLIINNIRVVCMEMISKAKSGHPGIALGAAPMMHTLFSKVLKFNPNDPKWLNRDRFVLAAGHGSSLLYTIMHLSGFDISVEDLKRFRQLHSNTAGHPEVNLIKGIDASSGPLGQGIPMGVGMAISEVFLANRYNKQGFEIFNNYTYVLCGDGDLQEGITLEAISLAGHLKLNKLIVLYDSNDIQLDGSVSACNTENTEMKFKSMNWNYLKVEDGEDTLSILESINKAKQSELPTIIEIKTIIGKSSSKEGKCDVHGSPLDALEVLKMRETLTKNSFEFFDETKKAYQDAISNNLKIYQEEVNKVLEFQALYPAEYLEIEMFLNHTDELTLDNLSIPFDLEANEPTRNVIGKLLKNVSQISPILIGGSADVARSTNVMGSDGPFTFETPFGRNICYGVREHAMGAISNGIYLYGITKSFCGGFFVFSDYLKPAVRMSALMNLPVMYFFSHDSIAVGEDGPTHQPVEHLTMFRSIPNVNLIRPAGQEETKEAFLIAYNSKETPTIVVTSRQKVKESRTESSEINLTSSGAYIIREAKGVLQGIIIASGTEVNLAIEVSEKLLEEGKSFRVVSMPSMYLFDKQDAAYKEKVLPKDKYIIAIEMSEGAHLYKYVGNGRVYNINSFGLSGKAEDVISHFGYTQAKICEQIRKDLES